MMDMRDIYYIYTDGCERYECDGCERCLLHMIAFDVVRSHGCEGCECDGCERCLLHMIALDVVRSHGCERSLLGIHRWM